MYSREFTAAALPPHQGPHNTAFPHHARHKGVFHHTPENDVGTLSLYYDLPWLSMRGMLYHPIKTGAVKKSDVMMVRQGGASECSPMSQHSGHTRVPTCPGSRPLCVAL